MYVPKSRVSAVLSGLAALIVLGIALVAARPWHSTSAETPRPSAATPAHNAGETFVPPPAVASTLRKAVIHWPGSSYSYNPASRDPYNGKTTTSDIWAQTDANGAIVKFHAVYTAPDGIPFQEVLQDTSRTTRVFGPAYAAVFPTPAPLPSGATPGAATAANPFCQSGPGGLSGLSASKTQSLLPPFVDPKALPQQGFELAQANASPPAVPAAATSIDLAPVQTYPSSQTVQLYTKRVPAPADEPETHTVEVQPDGRIVQLEATVTDAKGDILGQARQTFGPVQVYNPSSVPASVFTLSPFGQEACHA